MLKRLWPLKAVLPFSNKTKSQKSSRFSPLHIRGQVGQPLWTPRRYDSLAEEGYTKNVIVYRCVNLISRGLSSVPWLLYETQEDGSDHEVYSHPLLSLLNNPSSNQAGSSFIETVVGFLLLAGNSYIEAVFDENGNVFELYALRPDRVSLVADKGGNVSGYEYRVGGVARSIPLLVGGGLPILHLKYFHPLHDFYGFSPLEAAASSIDQHNEVAGHNISILQNGGRPSGALLLKDKNLHPEQRDQLKQELDQFYQGGKNAGRILMLEGDFEWKEMGLSPKDLDFIEGKNVSAREIAQAFGVPPMLVGVSGDATFANYKEARLHLWEDTVLPLLEFLVAELNLWLAPFFGPNLRISYDIDGIPALAVKREAHWNKIATSDFLTLNEKRQAVGYGSIEGGDSLYPLGKERA